MAGLFDIYQTYQKNAPKRQKQLAQMHINASIYIYQACIKRAQYGVNNALINLKDFMVASLDTGPFFNFNEEWNKSDAIELLVQTINQISPINITINNQIIQVKLTARYYDSNNYVITWA